MSSSNSSGSRERDPGSAQKTALSHTSANAQSPFFAPRSSSTPYDLYKARRGHKDDISPAPPSPSRHSPFMPGTPLGSRFPQSSLGASAGSGAESRSSSISSSANSPVRRKGASVGSPGMRATHGSGAAASAGYDGSARVPQTATGSAPRKPRQSRAFVRTKTFRQR